MGEDELWTAHMLLVNVLPTMHAAEMDDDLRSLSIAARLIRKNVESLITWDDVEIPLGGIRAHGCDRTSPIIVRIPSCIGTVENARYKIVAHHDMVIASAVPTGYMYVKVPAGYTTFGIESDRGYHLEVTGGYGSLNGFIDSIPIGYCYCQYQIPLDRGWICQLGDVELQYSSLDFIRPRDVSLEFTENHIYIPGVIGSVLHVNRLTVKFSIDPVSLPLVDCAGEKVSINVFAERPPDRVLIHIKHGERQDVPTLYTTDKAFTRNGLVMFLKFGNGINAPNVTWRNDGKFLCKTADLPDDLEKMYTADEISKWVEKYEVPTIIVTGHARMELPL